MGSLIWYAGEHAIVNDGPYKGVEVEILKAVGHEDKVLVRTVDDEAHCFLVRELDLEMLEDITL